MAVIKVCEQCKKEFPVSARRSDGVRFCSRNCKTEHGWITLPCGHCGTEFRRKKSDTLRSRTFYCSTECTAAARLGRKHQINPDAPRYYKVCETCSKDFRVTATRQDSARWCSRECQSASQSWKESCAKIQQGENGWRWEGGVYKNHAGYIQKRFDGNPRELEHRSVIVRLMIEVSPNHPFLVFDGELIKLDSDIEVHHIDRDRSNNAPSNLLAVTKIAHAQIHHHNRKPKPWECWPSNPERW